MVHLLYYKSTSYAITNPFFIRFSCKNLIIPTRKKDAQVLEDYGRLLNPKPTIPDEDIQMELHDLHVLRNALATERGVWKQRKLQYNRGNTKRFVERVSKALDKEIAALDDTIEQRVKSQEVYKAIFEEVVKIVGVGRNTACAILCLLPEIGVLNSNKISKLAGLAPIPHESGTSIKKPAHIRGGRKHVRTALYMPCLTACRYNPVLRTYYQRIKEHKGGDKVKGAKAIALTATMRKLLIHINSVARRVREKLQRNVAAVGCGEAAQASPCR